MNDLSTATEEIQQLAREWPMGYSLDLPHDATVVIAGMYKGRVAELLTNLYANSDPLTDSEMEIFGFDPQGWALQLLAACDPVVNMDDMDGPVCGTCSQYVYVDTDHTAECPWALARRFVAQVECPKCNGNGRDPYSPRTSGCFHCRATGKVEA